MANQPNVVYDIRKCDVGLKYIVRSLPGIKYYTISQFSGEFSSIQKFEIQELLNKILGSTSQLSVYFKKA